ncbi:hypothetical protein HDV03_001221 [Kappamyces sp. JEL0829]|nr:hypothetical protein HDV03_001221 [Kappamyces sp. JEL0829]
MKQVADKTALKDDAGSCQLPQIKMIAATLVQLVALAAAFPQAAQLPVGQWAPKAASDVRSPCPIFNTMANHGFLPRDGKTPMPRQDVVKAFQTQMSIDPSLTNLLIDATFQLGLGSAASQSFSLEDLNTHNAIEHDASLFRNDNQGGLFNNHDVNATLVQQLVSYSTDGKHISINDLAKYRRDRFAYAKKSDPFFTFGPKQEFLAFGESALLAETISAANPKMIPIDVMVEFVLNERLPTAQGWVKRPDSVNSFNVGVFAAELKAKAGIFNS